MADTDPYDELEWRNRVYDVLVGFCGADPHLRNEFLVHWPDCIEFRFVGSLGFGGKVWHHRWGGSPYVNCYPEDMTPEREAMILHANEALSKITAC